MYPRLTSRNGGKDVAGGSSSYGRYSRKIGWSFPGRSVMTLPHSITSSPQPAGAKRTLSVDTVEASQTPDFAVTRTADDAEEPRPHPYPKDVSQVFGGKMGGLV